MMRDRLLGRSGLRVSELCLGAMVLTGSGRRVGTSSTPRTSTPPRSGRSIGLSTACRYAAGTRSCAPACSTTLASSAGVVTTMLEGATCSALRARDSCSSCSVPDTRDCPTCAPTR